MGGVSFTKRRFFVQEKSVYISLVDSPAATNGRGGYPSFSRLHDRMYWYSFAGQKRAVQLRRDMNRPPFAPSKLRYLLLLLGLAISALTGCFESERAKGMMGDVNSYRVVLEGRNFVLDFDGVRARHGFFTTRYVQARDEKEAELKAVELIREDTELVGAVKNQQADPPMIYLDEIEELPSLEGVNAPGSGYSFYVEADESN